MALNKKGRKAEQKHELDELLRKQIQDERDRAEFLLLQEQADALVPKPERLDLLYDSGLAVGKGSSSDKKMTSENTNDTPLQNSDGFEDLLPLPHKDVKVEAFMKNKKSKVWNEFAVIPSSLEGEPLEPRCKCVHCHKDVGCKPKKDGTSTMLSHLQSCKPYKAKMKEKGQKGIDEMCPKKVSTNCGDVPKDIRKTLVKYFVKCELSLRHVESEAFREFIGDILPGYKPPSRTTLGRDVFNMFLDEKKKLKSYFRENDQRVCLTTDTWTSNQNLNYMALTAHFIDKDWKLQKKILNFCTISSHKGEEIGMVVENCLSDWGIDKVFTVTVDNAKSNDTTIAYVKRVTNRLGGAILNGEFMHMRCCAHILNLIVNDGTKEMKSSVDSVRHAVTYVRSSPVRYAKFKQIKERLKIEFKGTLCLDCPTRWNSTYLMLDCAVKFRKVFDAMAEDDHGYIMYFQDDNTRREGPPDDYDWDNAAVLLEFLKEFHDITLCFSGTLSVTSNMCFNKIGSVEIQIKEMAQTGNSDTIRKMAQSMKNKFDKYWEGAEKVNPLMLISVILDPRLKFDYIEFVLNGLYSIDVAKTVERKIKVDLERLFDEYVIKYPSDGNMDEDSTLNDGSQNESLFKSGVDHWRSQTSRRRKMSKSELNTYLDEDVLQNSNDFDILTWWKVNSSKYKILSRLARDVLAIPVSSVASEFVFSTSSRILNDYRSSLTWQMAEALVCLPNWLSDTSADIQSTDILEDLLQSMEISESPTDVPE